MVCACAIVLTVGFAIVASRADPKSNSPLAGFWPMQHNGITPLESVMRDGHGEHRFTNWHSVTSDSAPKIITSYLKAPKDSRVAPGQVWVSSSASYVNTPEVFVRPRETNEIFGEIAVFAESRITNDWPQLTYHTDLIYVRSIEKGTYGIVKGMDYYARCRVRMWSNTSAYVEGESNLLLSLLTNNATLLKFQSK